MSQERRLPDLTFTVQPMGYIEVPCSRLEHMALELQDQVRETGHDISLQKCAEIIFDSTWEFAKELCIDRDKAREALSEVIRQRDAIVSRELKRQERERLSRGVLTIQIWGSE